jgi:diguanylate cyclase (GGDEF)-like protein
LPFLSFITIRYLLAKYTLRGFFKKLKKRRQRKQQKDKKSALPVVAMLVLTVFCIFATMAVTDWESSRINNLVRENARAVFQTVVNFRAWNAQHGGVYVTESETTKANQYLPPDIRSTETINGDKLVLMNPAYMARQVGELSAQMEGPNIRITSLSPVRPQNAPLSWEKEALEAFEKKAIVEFGNFDLNSNPQARYRYAAPLITEAACLKCHGQHGYKVGDVRGAVTVDLPAQQYVDDKAMHRQASHMLGSLIWALGMVIIVLTNRMIINRRKALEELRDMSIRDPLTGLLNRRGFITMAEQSLKTLARENGTAVLAFADLDRLKELNDQQGHSEGDAALERIGLGLRKAFRESDLVGRLGGDEFAILLVDGSYKYADILKDRIQSTVEITNQGWDRRIPIALSVGMIPVEFSNDKKDFNINELLDRADKRMYEVKKNKRRLRSYRPPHPSHPVGQA